MKHASLLIVTVLLALFSLSMTEAAPPVQPKIGRGVQEALDAAGQARVLITLRDPVATTVGGARRARAVAQVQGAVLGGLAAGDFRLMRRYNYVPGLAGTINRSALNALRADPQVAAIQLDEPGTVQLSEAVPALGADVVHTSYHLTGQGVTVAMLDSGIDTDHPDLSDAIVAQHCFTAGACPPGNTNESDSAEDENGHGTNVAGIITANGIVSPIGFAPDAKIVAVRVVDASGSGWISDWVAGFDWLIGQRAALNIRVLNMSLGTNSLYGGTCDAEQSTMSNAITQLAAAGVVIFASSGNQGSSSQISAPACNTGVIAVGATYDSNLGREPDSGTYSSLFGGGWPGCADVTTSSQTIACFTDSNLLLDVVAPGARMTSAGIGGGVSTYVGTSQAAPVGAGIAALMLQANSALTPADIEFILKTTGTRITDPKNGLQFPAIHAQRAVAYVLAATPTPTPTSTPSATLTATRTATLTPIATPTASRTATPTATQMASPTATPTATRTATVTPTATPTHAAGYGDLAGHVSLQGRADSAGASISLDGTAATSTGAGGQYWLYNVVPGVHHLRVERASYLCTETTTTVNADQTSSLAEAALRAGDITGDGQINIFDLVLVGSSYGTNPPSDSRADFNGDNRIDIFDLVMLGGNYGLRCPTPWLAAATAPSDSHSASPAQIELRYVPGSGQQATVEVWARDVEGLFGAEVRLHFDPLRLRAIGGESAAGAAWWQSNLFEDAAEGFAVRNSADNIAGEAILAATRLAPAAALAGDLMLGRLVFEPATSEPATVRLSGATLVDRDGRALTAEVRAGEAYVGGRRVFLPFVGAWP